MATKKRKFSRRVLKAANEAWRLSGVENARPYYASEHKRLRQRALFFEKIARELMASARTLRLAARNSRVHGSRVSYALDVSRALLLAIDGLGAAMAAAEAESTACRARLSALEEQVGARLGPRSGGAPSRSTRFVRELQARVDTSSWTVDDWVALDETMPFLPQQEPARDPRRRALKKILHRLGPKPRTRSNDR